MEAKETGEIFERMAAQYDTWERVGVVEIIAEEIGAHIADAAEKDALDYGCDTGLVGLRLLDRLRSLLFVDASLFVLSAFK